MSRKFVRATIGLLALVAFAGTAIVATSSAAPSHVALQNKASGLSTQSVKIARKSGLPSALVTMAPQSSLSLLSHATKIGPHAVNSRLKLTVSLKLRNVAKLKQFLRQVQYSGSPVYHQWLTPQEFTRLYGPTKAQVARVKAFLKAHGITVLNVSPNRILIHTEASTEIYEHALGIRINNYKLNGRTFYSTTESPKIPRAIAPLVLNIIGLNHGAQMHPLSLFRQP